jgi:transmembrane sensor
MAGIILALVASATYLAIRPATATYETEPGQRLTLTLPDGSRVLLSAASRLRVAGSFGARERAVELQGQAYFVVQPDARRPFLVRTAHGTAHELGTEFDVREYPQDSAVQVVVASGEVLLRGHHGEDASRTLRAHDRGVVGGDGQVTVVNDVQLESYLAWTEGRLVFDQTPLGEIMTELERWYDVELVMGDATLDAERVTITFAQQTADQALTELATVLDAHVVRTDRRIQLVRVRPPQ